MVVSPDLILAYGPRAFLSLTGIVTLVTGVWHVDRTWDEKGSKAYERAKKDSSGGTVTIPTKDLDDAFPFPWAFLLGWAMFAISFLFPVDGSTAIVTSPSILAAVGCSLALGVIASVPMGEAVRNRNGPRKAMLGMLFLLFWILLTVASSLANGKTATMFCPIGADLLSFCSVPLYFPPDESLSTSCPLLSSPIPLGVACNGIHRLCRV